MTTHTKLHVKPGTTALHIDDETHTVAADGTVNVPAHHVETALSLGASHTPHAAPAPTVDRMADLEARVASLELTVADLRGKRK